jgi:BirA family transcriptional regulator, biotin operon repressor / biotin---[acetyl-CoA-carboxylase] ligase
MAASSMYDDLDRPPLHADVLERALVTSDSLWSRVEVVETSPSTNADLAELAASSDEDGVVRIAEHQTAGRGRLDRTWTAPPRSGLTMSVLIRPGGREPVPAARWPWIPLLAGLAVAATLRRDADVAAVLKWPNDVLIEDRKVAGLLVERVDAGARGRGIGSTRTAAVIGIGLNVSLRADELPVPTATSLVLAGASSTDRSLLARGVLRSLSGLLSDWYRHGGDPRQGLQTAYVEACDTLGRQVRVEQADGTAVVGEAVSVDDSGRLLVRTDAGQKAVGAGDVLHLRAEP